MCTETLLSIQKLLENHPDGLTIKDIADILRMNRITVNTYLHELIGEGKVNVRTVGMAKLHYLAKFYSDNR